MVVRKDASSFSTCSHEHIENRRSNSFTSSSDDYSLIDQEESPYEQDEDECCSDTVILLNKKEKKKKKEKGRCELLQEQVVQLTEERQQLVDGIQTELDVTKRDLFILKSRIASSAASSSSRHFALCELFIVAVGFFAVYYSLQGLKAWHINEPSNYTSTIDQRDQWKDAIDRLRNEVIDQQRLVQDLRHQLKLAELLLNNKKKQNNMETQTDDVVEQPDQPDQQRLIRDLQAENEELRKNLHHSNLRNGQLTVELSMAKRNERIDDDQLTKQLNEAKATINRQAERIAVLDQQLLTVESSMAKRNERIDDDQLVRQLNEAKATINRQAERIAVLDQQLNDHGKNRRRPCDPKATEMNNNMNDSPPMVSRKQLKKLEKELNMHKNRAELFQNLYKEARFDHHGHNNKNKHSKLEEFWDWI